MAALQLRVPGLVGNTLIAILLLEWIYGKTIGLPGRFSEEKNFEILVKDGNRKTVIDYRDIIYAQGLKDYTILQTTKKKFVVKGLVKSMEAYLPADYFMRVHKSFIVAKNKIRLVYKNKIELEEIVIPIGRIYKDAVEQFLQSRGKKENL